MDSGHDEPVARVPLPPSADPAGRASYRREGFRHARRVSNWTAAALIVGAGAAAVAFAHQAWPAAGAAPPGPGTNITGPGAAGTGSAGAGPASAAATGGPQVSHSVATTSASGVTVTTTTRTVNGRTILTQTRSAPRRGGDD